MERSNATVTVGVSGVNANGATLFDFKGNIGSLSSLVDEVDFGGQRGLHEVSVSVVNELADIKSVGVATLHRRDNLLEDVGDVESHRVGVPGVLNHWKFYER